MRRSGEGQGWRAPPVRRGSALVAALALVALAGALLAGAAVTATASGRAVRSERAALVAEAGVRHALAAALAAWGAEADSLAVGATVERVLAPAELGAASGLPLSGRLRVDRLAAGLYALAADVRVGEGQTLARRRLRLLVDRPLMPAPIDSSGGAPGDSASPIVPGNRRAPAPISRWSMADLY